MALRIWLCKKCELVERTFRDSPIHCDEPMELQLSAPQAKFMEPRAPGAKSVLKDQTKILKARTRDHSREFELDELIANNPEHLAKQNQWITPQGRRRKRIDDI